MISEITDENFVQEVLNSEKLILVDFWAPWCGPCKMLGPILEEINQEIGNEIQICKINIDNYPLKAGEYEVRSIPTLMLFKDGKLVDTKVGAPAKQVILTWINSNI